MILVSERDSLNHEEYMTIRQVLILIEKQPDNVATKETDNSYFEEVMEMNFSILKERSNFPSPLELYKSDIKIIQSMITVIQLQITSMEKSIKHANEYISRQ